MPQGNWVPCATTTEPMTPRAETLKQQKTYNEKTVHLKNSSPHLPQLEEACGQQRRPSAAKNKLIKVKKNESP